MQLRFDYFKPRTGKWYSKGYLDLPEDHLPMAQFLVIGMPQARSLIQRGKRPGMVNGFDLDVLISCDGHPVQFLKRGDEDTLINEVIKGTFPIEDLDTKVLLTWVERLQQQSDEIEGKTIWLAAITPVLANRLTLML